MVFRFPALCLLIPLAALPVTAQSLVEGYAPVAVSAANYRASSREELKRAVNETPTLDAPPPPVKAGEPMHYIFVPGELDNREMPYAEVCRLLEEALAKAGYFNAADANEQLTRRIEDIPLLLRISYGTTRWRLPIIRLDQLSWKDGLRPRRKRAVGDVVWHYREGGDDLARASLNGGGSISVGDFGETQNYHLLIVDAFDYAEVREKGNSAQRVWTTFISAPERNKSTFTNLAASMVTAGLPYFGKTSSGLQVYRDVKAQVDIGDLEVQPD